MRVNRFKLVRLEKGLRQLDVARAAGIAEGYMSRIETGRVIPSPELLRRLAAALDVPTESLDEDCDRGR